MVSGDTLKDDEATSLNYALVLSGNARSRKNLSPFHASDKFEACEFCDGKERDPTEDRWNSISGVMQAATA
jgi:hypothetical protein